MRLHWLFALIYIIFNILFIMTGEGLISGPRVLCLDGGGFRGLSDILILKELMLQVQLHNGLNFTSEPWQCFDLVEQAQAA